MSRLLYSAVISVWCALQLLVSAYEQPITAQEYHDQLGIGFSVSWFYKPLAYTIPPKVREYTHASLKVTVKDMVNGGINHLRLRCRSDRHGFPEPGAGEPPRAMDAKGMKAFLDELEFIVDEMLAVGLYPVISWYNEPSTIRGSEQDAQNFVQWWTEVAKRFKHKSYKVSFDLFTELERLMDKDDPKVKHNLYVNTTGLSDWSRRTIKAIRKTGGNNLERVIILVTPHNTDETSLYDIDTDLYAKENGPIIQEYHICAGGATKHNFPRNRCPWSGKGQGWQKKKLQAHLDAVTEFGQKRDVPIYFGAWMVPDRRYNTTTPFEYTHFAQFFAKALKQHKFPSTINQILFFYDTRKNVWVKENNMGKALRLILQEWKG